MMRCDTSFSTEAHDGLTGSTALAALPAVLGVINSGGVLADGLISSQTAARVRAVFAPKLVSAAAMHREVASLPAGQQLMFSSVAALIGSAGEANYAAANAALEGWVTASSSQGMSVLAVQWGAWAAGELRSSSAVLIR